MTAVFNARMRAEAQYGVDAVCSEFHVRPEDLAGLDRSQRVAWPRLVAYYVLRERFNWALVDIGALFGRDHSTVFMGAKRVGVKTAAVKVDRELVEAIVSAAQVAARASVPVAEAARAGDVAWEALERGIAQLDATIAEATAERDRLSSALSALNVTSTGHLRWAA